ncbi:hypothetical protein BU16DRAFT_532455 [Lophium mytilinum]|uniref:Uncharacterized protein n=1 Tax=Lophium mytilinum TaxID=390894 RepID=A0A6A6RCD4_9PEZI|nr:hypothetical protein BU16DRAFT_532455 [Lophium mytilinum]
MNITSARWSHRLSRLLDPPSIHADADSDCRRHLDFSLSDIIARPHCSDARVHGAPAARVGRRATGRSERQTCPPFPRWPRFLAIDDLPASHRYQSSQKPFLSRPRTTARQKVHHIDLRRPRALSSNTDDQHSRDIDNQLCNFGEFGSKAFDIDDQKPMHAAVVSKSQWLLRPSSYERSIFVPRSASLKRYDGCSISVGVGKPRIQY